MKKRRIGNSDLEVAPLAFGGNVFGWTVDEQTSFRLLDAFVDAGLNLIDTADVYSVWHRGNQGGESEAIIGKWLKQSGKRDEVVVATKVGMKMSPSLGSESLSKSYIMKAVDQSLKRLRVDHIDLYQAHIDDAKTPIEETLDAFSQLVKQGKVRALGASSYSRERLAQSLKISEENGLARFDCLQPEYNLYERENYEMTLEPLCVENGVAVITYFSLARGFLSGKYRSEADLAQSARGEGVKKYLNERGYRILRALDQVAKDCRATPAQVALAWLIARPSITAPIASATGLNQLEDMVAATKLRLDSSAIELLNEASEYAAAAAR
ncbi:MAG TPA: aldo/keto reductase [Candidatus Obscuribacterales bacterium]